MGGRCKGSPEFRGHMKRDGTGLEVSISISHFKLMSSGKWDRHVDIPLFHNVYKRRCRIASQIWTAQHPVCEADGFFLVLPADTRPDPGKYIDILGPRSAFSWSSIAQDPVLRRERLTELYKLVGCRHIKKFRIMIQSKEGENHKRRRQSLFSWRCARRGHFVPRVYGPLPSWGSQIGEPRTYLQKKGRRMPQQF